MKRYLSRISINLMILALAGLIALTALANPRPFHLVEHGTLSGNTDGSIAANGTGTATHLGSITVQRTFTLTPTSVANELQVEGHATLVAANGDTLETGLSGILTVNGSTGHAVLAYDWEGGTGRFRNASGTTVWQVDVNLADMTYDVVADGVINY